MQIGAVGETLNDAKLTGIWCWHGNICKGPCGPTPQTPRIGGFGGRHLVNNDLAAGVLWNLESMKSLINSSTPEWNRHNRGTTELFVLQLGTELVRLHN